MVLGFLPVALVAQETKVQMKDLPPAVQKTVQDQTRTAKLRGLAKEIENGKTFYEAETTVNGKSRDVLIDPSGAVVEVEEATTLAAIPEPARKAFQQHAGAAGKILSVETVTRGSAVSYEAVIQKAVRNQKWLSMPTAAPQKKTRQWGRPPGLPMLPYFFRIRIFPLKVLNDASVPPPLMVPVIIRSTLTRYRPSGVSFFSVIFPPGVSFMSKSL